MEETCAAKRFRSIFEPIKRQKIALYGISQNTDYILRETMDFSIVGLMDGYRTNGSIYGKPILSSSEALEKGIQIIIIIARANSTKIIFRRIRDFCSHHGIAVYDWNGRNLMNEEEPCQAELEALERSPEELQRSIDAYDAVSFDIFDTLLMRRVLYPEDIFELVCRYSGFQTEYHISFTSARCLAERELMRFTTPAWDEIYEKLKETYHLSEEQTRQLQRLEWDVEQSVLIARDEMIQIFKYAIQKRKRVFLVSDMYYPAKLLEKLLSRFGISGYEKLLVSCEYGTSKSQNLFGVLREELQGQTCLHIGDNPDTDGLAPRQKQLDFFQVKSALELLELSSYRDLLSITETLEDRIIIGMLIARIFNSPFALYHSKGRVRLHSGYDIGYVFIAPIVTQFMVWLLDQLHRDRPELILFAARDGYLIRRLYRLAVKYSGKGDLPKEKYLITSRSVCIGGSLYDRSDIAYAANMGFNGSPMELLEKRFGISLASARQTSAYEDLDELLSAYQDEILDHSKKLRNNYLKYLETQQLRSASRVAFFDFVSSGSCQMGLEQILNKHMTGYYFIHVMEAYDKKKKLSVKSLFQAGDSLDMNYKIYENYLFLESILTSFKPTADRFNDQGQPVYLEEKRSGAEITYIREAQTAIIDYFKLYWKLTEKFKPSVRTELSDQILDHLHHRYTVLDNPVLNNMEAEDEFCNRSMHLNEVI